MTTDTVKAIEATKQLAAAVPFLGGSSFDSDYRKAMKLVNYLIENDDENLLIDFLASKIAVYECNTPGFAEFNEAIAKLPDSVALLRTLIDQPRLTYSDLEDKIGSKSLVSQILSGQRSLTITHIKALSAPLWC